MDPVGAGLVMDEYYTFLHLDFLSFSAKVMGTIFALIETLIGAALITGVWRGFIAKFALGLQIFFTVITLFLVIFNPEMDCGCFGEAIHLTHMQTFVKNIILLVLLLAYFIPQTHLGETKRRKYISFSIIGISVLCFTIYSWIYIPLIDFTAYKPGAELVAGAEIDPDEVYEPVFTYEKDGIQETFTRENLPDSTWTFVSTEIRTKNDKVENLVELPIRDSHTEEDLDILARRGKVMIVSIYDTEMDSKEWEEANEFIQRATDAGFTSLLLCARRENIPDSLKDRAYLSDYKALISLNRSNGGVTYFSDGILIRKWARISAPDTAELKEILNTDTTEILIDTESKGSLGFQGFLLYIFAIMLLL